MTVERTEIADVHTLKDILLMRDSRLQGIGESDKATPTVVLQQSYLVQPACQLKTQGIIGLVGVQREQIFLHATHGTVDRHVVVIENNEDVIVR